jgi:uncharacterized phage protein (TIGR01671 family)
MREHKYKVWDKHLKKMLDFNEDQLSCYGYDPKTGNFILVTDADYIWLQYTGLKDKNGVEIYDGDIIVKDEYLWFDDDKPNYRGTVEWIFSAWQVVAHCVNKDKSGISDGINNGLNDEGEDEGSCSMWEVIGNIYENPELLTHDHTA